jgi:RNA polymerase sigma-70 factor (ECF subfamily)
VAGPASIEPGPGDALVDGLRRKDECAFQTLVARHGPALSGYVRHRVSNRADAEDTLQEVFSAVVTSIHTYRGEAPLRAWLFGLTRHMLASRFRRKELDLVPLDDATETSLVDQEPDASPFAMCARRQQIGRIRTRLTEGEQQLVWMHHAEALSIREIARARSETAESVKSRLYRARRTLRTSAALS